MNKEDLVRVEVPPKVRRTCRDLAGAAYGGEDVANSITCTTEELRLVIDTLSAAIGKEQAVKLYEPVAGGFFHNHITEDGTVSSGPEYTSTKPGVHMHRIGLVGKRWFSEAPNEVGHAHTIETRKKR